MNVFRPWIAGGGVALLLAGAGPARADITNDPPDFKEVYELIRSNLSGVSDEQLNQAAVQGLIDQLHAKVTLVAGPADGNAASPGAPTVQSFVYDGGIIRLRVGEVADGLAEKLRSTEKDAASGTNTVKGLVLDLRYATGLNYSAAVAAANVFIPDEKPVLDWGAGVVNSKANTEALSLPVVVLVNKQTTGAAEALAAMMRTDAHAIILGAPTAGEATVGKDFPLKDGEFLRIVTEPVKLGDRTPLTGVKPDIQVSVRPDDEKAYFNDPYKDLGGNTNGVGGQGTNAPARRLSEADLIRERKERPGMDLEYLELPDTGPDDPAAAARALAWQRPVVHDPVLARALDLIKGIAAFGPGRTP